MEILIKRIYLSNGTIGYVYINDQLFCYTIERAWLNNTPRQSCIPEGSYKLTKRQSPKFGITCLVNDVPNRSAILIHSGNLPTHSLGCILPNSQISFVKGEIIGSGSKLALQNFNNIVFPLLDNGQEVILKIEKYV